MSSQTTVVPAQLGFLAIFNPSLGVTDETMDDQIVYYTSINIQSQKRSQKRRHRSRGKPTDGISQEERNERLRQIGLAQGMVEFSRGFANGEPVNTIETEKTRVVLQEVEPGWWILASIDLTRIPLPPRLGASTSGEAGELPENVEYSTRELKPTSLLTHDLLRAHSVFLLHHASSLSALFVKSRRTNFIKVLSRFWDLFVSMWDVMLHGNPASHVFGGIKIAACGELGVGVGEENRGSGERDVLEGFVGRIEGLTDLVVSKFGSSETTADLESSKDENPGSSSVQWMGTGEEPGAEDGAIFLGVGTLSRKSLRDITYWMEDIYSWGENAYGVKDSPASTRQDRRRKKSVAISRENSGNHPRPKETGSPDHSSSTRDTGPQKHDEPEPSRLPRDDETVDEGGMTKFMSYLKMGYGTHWSLGGSEGGEKANTPTKDSQPVSAREHSQRKPLDNCGHYLIGLLGNMDEANTDEGERLNQPDDEAETSEYNSRILLRTVTVELDGAEHEAAQQEENPGGQSTELTLTQLGNKDHTNPNSQFNSQDRNKTQKMRVVVYVNKPFIFTFLFRNMTDSLAWEGLYRSLHHQLGPLRKPLALSTAYRPNKPDAGEQASHIFDLVWDPKAMTLHSTIPSIPTPVEMLRDDRAPVWSRAEAVNTHNQILNMYAATMTDLSELERTCKTNRGWWVVWSRILERDSGQPQNPEIDNASANGNPARDPVPPLQHNDSQESDSSHDQVYAAATPRPKVWKEIFLIRRAGEHTGARGISSSSYSENGGGSWAEGASRLAQGIGVDTNKYIEGLLTMGR